MTKGLGKTDMRENHRHHDEVGQESDPPGWLTSWALDLPMPPPLAPLAPFPPRQLAALPDQSMRYGGSIAALCYTLLRSTLPCRLQASWGGILPQHWLY